MINDFPVQISELQHSSSHNLLSSYSHDRESHPTALSSSVKKKSQVFVQELEKLHQHFLSNGDDHAFLEKKKKKRLTY